MTRGIIIPVAAIAAVLFAVAIPNLSKARNRSRQKQTMADMRSIATAWEARATDRNSYAVGVSRPTPAELARVLEPTYIRQMPRQDAWGTEFHLMSTADTYTIRALGSDRRADRVATLSGVTTNFSDDIVFSDGVFVRYPEEAG